MFIRRELKDFKIEKNISILIKTLIVYDPVKYILNHYFGYDRIFSN